jgi:hypothetical protein
MTKQTPPSIGGGVGKRSAAPKQQVELIDEIVETLLNSGLEPHEVLGVAANVLIAVALQCFVDPKRGIREVTTLLTETVARNVDDPNAVAH